MMLTGMGKLQEAKKSTFHGCPNGPFHIGNEAFHVRPKLCTRVRSSLLWKKRSFFFRGLVTIVGLLFLMLTGSCKEQAKNRAGAAKERVVPVMNAYLNPLGLKVGSPVFIRIIKEDRILELWGRPDQADRFILIKRYPIAGMSGGLGPKMKEGDKQAPEGFYSVTAKSLNPYSNYHLSFNVGYPNDYDKALGRTGSLIMVHGSDVSVGCFAITDEGVEEVYTMVAEALANGQEKVDVQIHPFVPTPSRMANAKGSPHDDFWKIMRQAWEWTERNGTPAPYVINGKEISIGSGE